MKSDYYLYNNKFIETKKANIKLSFGEGTSAYFQYYMENVPNKFQRWLLLKVFGIKLEKI